jgi:SET domain-containing protein
VFAAAPIVEGAEVWRFTPELDLDLDPALLEPQPQQLREYLRTYGYVDLRLKRYILCCDEARFISHSDTANLRPDFARDRYGVDVAARHRSRRRTDR